MACGCALPRRILTGRRRGRPGLLTARRVGAKSGIAFGPAIVLGAAAGAAYFSLRIRARADPKPGIGRGQCGRWRSSG